MALLARKMTETEAQIHLYLPDVLVGIVVGYFESNFRGTWSIAEAGEFEETIRLIEDEDSNPIFALHGACFGGWVEIARALSGHLADLMPDYRELEINGMMRNACEGGATDCAQLMIDLGATGWDHGLLGACYAEDGLACARLMVAHGATHFEKALLEACGGDSPEVAQLMIDMGATDVHWAAIEACKYGQARCAKLMFEHNGASCHALTEACEHGHEECVRLAVDYGADNCQNDTRPHCANCSAGSREANFVGYASSTVASKAGSDAAKLR